MNTAPIGWATATSYAVEVGGAAAAGGAESFETSVISRLGDKRALGFYVTSRAVGGLATLQPVVRQMIGSIPLTSD